MPVIMEKIVKSEELLYKNHHMFYEDCITTVHKCSKSTSGNQNKHICCWNQLWFQHNYHFKGPCTKHLRKYRMRHSKNIWKETLIMNFNFNNQRTKFHLGQPIMRHFSAIGLVTLKPDQNDYNLKQDFGFKNVQHNILQNFGGSVLSNKSFSNPNFVNKENPHILSTKINGTVNFDKQKFVENVSPHLFIQQPKHLNCNNKKIEEENSVVYQPTSDKLSSQSSTQNIVNTSEMPAPISNDFSVKTMKKKRNKKNRKNSKVLPKQNLAPMEPNLNSKVAVISKKSKSLCSAPKKIKKEPESKIRCRGKSKKDKPWHKISLEMEIMECDESSIPTPEIEENLDKQNCVIKKSCPIEILSTNCKNMISEAISFSLSPCADILKNLSTSNTSSSDLSSMSPSSPAIRRLRLPSECDSEDSFIVFCDDSNSCMTEESSAVEELSDSDFDFDVTDFQEKTDLNKGIAKKVTFRCDPELCEIHPMIQWGFAYQSARRGPWEQIARDRARFECRIKKTESEISRVLDPCHRDRIYHERFEEL